MTDQTSTVTTEKPYTIDLSHLGLGAMRVALAATIPAHLTPDPDLLRRYFGPGVPKAYLSSLNVPRNIFRKSDGKFVIFPDNKNTRKFITEA